MGRLFVKQFALPYRTLSPRERVREPPPPPFSLCLSWPRSPISATAELVFHM